MDKKRGFTLIELLATILVLSLIIGIVVYVSLNVINNAKEKTYKVTIKNIEQNADSYLMENSNRLFFLTNNQLDYEYQCVTVENLVDYGYLNNDIAESNVSKDDKVNITDYIYIERDIKTKAVTKSEYVNKNNEVLYELCGGAVIALGDISFISYPGINEWSTYKDITITYKLKNLNDQRTLNDYQFNHNYSGTSEYNLDNDTLANNTKTKVVKVTTNGKLEANIKLDSEVLALANININKIDTTGPVIAKGSYAGSNTVRHSVTIPLKVTDIGSGVDYTTFTKDDIEVYVGSNKITNITLSQVSDENYNLVINNDLYNDKITLKIVKDKVFDKIKNGNEEITIDTGITFNNTYTITYNMNGGTGTIANTTYTYAASGTVNLSSTKPTKTGYTFLGWSTSSSATTATYAAGAAYNRNVMEDITLYAVWALASYNCSAGYYLKKSNTSCTICVKNYYCVGGTYSYNTTRDQGITACANNKYTTSTGAKSVNECLYCNRWVRTDNQSVLANQKWQFYRDCRMISGTYTYKDYTNNTYTYTVTNGTGWIYTGQVTNEPDKQESGKEWYYMENYYMVTGWKKIDNYWYFFVDTDPDGNGSVNGNMLHDTTLKWNNKTYKFDKYGRCTNDDYKCN